VSLQNSDIKCSHQQTKGYIMNSEHGAFIELSARAEERARWAAVLARPTTPRPARVLRRPSLLRRVLRALGL
jgi:hypothetical protein